MRVDKSKWQKKTIGQIGKVISGSTPRTDNPSNWEDGTHNWVTPAELKGDKYHGSTQKKITDTALKTTNLTLMPVGTVLLSSRAPIGKVAITTEPMYCNQGFKNIECNASMYNEYLYYYLKYNNDELNRRGNGVTFKEISKKIVEQFPVIVPSLDEQKGIAAELDALQTMIDGYKSQLQDLDELIMSIFKNTFGEPISNPKGWEINILENIVSEDCTITYGIVQPGNDVNDGIPVVRPVDLIGTYVNKALLKKVAPEISDSYKRTILKGNEILICVRGTTGVVSFATEDMKDCNVTRGIVPLSFGQHNKWFMYWCIKSFEMNNLIQKYTKGATLKQINIKDLRQLPFPTPPLELQEQFGKQAELIETQRALLNQQISDAKDLMAERMQFYFS